MIKVLKDWLGRSNKLERIWLMAKIEFKLRYYENKLGLLWALIKPLSDIFIYYVAFEMVMKQGIPNFVSFLFIALVLWNFFVETTIGTIQILKVKKYLYEYTNMNKMEIYISTVISNLIGLFFNLIIFFLYYLFIASNTTPLTINAIYFIPVLLNLTIFSLAFAIILSNVYIIAKDITQVWQVVIGLGFWLSPILFKLETFREVLPALEYINPISGIVINARKIILYGQPPDWNTFYFGFGYSIFFLLIGLVLLNKLGAKASETL
jgi:ABC-type polysaccharide/polyol phosphate export permease